MYLWFTENAADFLVPLHDKTGLENSPVEFVCELTVPSEDVKWFLNNEELQESDKIKIVKDGKKHKIIIDSVNVDDEGQIYVSVGDKKSTAGLFVDGEYNWQPSSRGTRNYSFCFNDARMSL